jgi:hypothetical protein
MDYLAVLLVDAIEAVDRRARCARERPFVADLMETREVVGAAVRPTAETPCDA